MYESKASITAPDWLKTQLNWTQLTATDPDSPVGYSRKHDHSAAGDLIRLTIPSDWTQLKMPTDQRVFFSSRILKISELVELSWVAQLWSGQKLRTTSRDPVLRNRPIVDVRDKLLLAHVFLWSTMFYDQPCNGCHSQKESNRLFRHFAMFYLSTKCYLKKKTKDRKQNNRSCWKKSCI